MNYGQLKAAVSGYLHRSDADALMPVWLELAEQRIYYGEANAPALRIAAMACQTVLTGFDVPADFLAARLLHEYGDESRRLALGTGDLRGARRSYAWDGRRLLLSADQSLPIGLQYWARFDPLVNDADTNWLLTNAPNVYLTSMLVEAARWSRDDALGIREAANYASAVGSLHSTDSAAKISGARLVIQPTQGRTR